MSKKFVGENTLKKFMNLVIGSSIFPKESLSTDELNTLWDKCDITIGPESELSNWDYTLDDTNNTITLTFSNAQNTTKIDPLIVYGAYKKGDKVYDTIINSSINNGSSGFFRSANYIRINKGCKLKNPYRLFTARCVDNIIGYENLDLSELYNMEYMFESFAVTNSDIDFSFFKYMNTSNVTNMSKMFMSASSMMYAFSMSGLEYLNTSNVTDMNSMFSSNKTKAIDGIEKWNTSNVTNMSAMFSGCTNIISLDLTGWDTSKVTAMSNMFSNCKKLAEVKVSRSKFKLPDGVTAATLLADCACDDFTYVD